MSLKEAAKFFIAFQRNIQDENKHTHFIETSPPNPSIKRLIHNAIIWKGTFEQIIKIYSKTKLKKLHPEITTAIVLCLSEFLFDDNKVPAKVINDAVNIVETQSRKNYTNAVLRKISASITKVESAMFEDISRNQIGCYRFDKDIFANPTKKPDKWLSQAYSLPDWLSTIFLSEFNFARTVQIMKASNAFAPMFLRINTQKIEIDKAITEMSVAGFELEKTTTKNVFKLLNKLSIIDTDFFQNGWIYIQDLTSVEAVNADNIKLPENPRILDACAAPGGKISNLFEKLAGKADFTAIDVSENKIALLKENFQRLGHEKIKIIKTDFIDFAAKPEAEKYDLILVDAPCSNTGVLARKPDARWRLKQKDLESLSILQSKLLESACKLVKKQGFIIYSTCSILRAENQEKVKEFIASNPNFKLLEEKTWLPQVDGYQGGFSATLQNT